MPALLVGAQLAHRGAPCRGELVVTRRGITGIDTTTREDPRPTVEVEAPVPPHQEGLDAGSRIA